jgi:tetratricopeptide (TPR) repeat protein
MINCSRNTTGYTNTGMPTGVPPHRGLKLEHLIKHSDGSRLILEVNQLVAQRQYKRALSVLESLIDRDPENPELYALLGDVSQNLDKNEAIAYYKRGLAIDPKNAHLNIGIGFLYFNGKHFINAEKHLLNIWIEDPTNIRLLTALGKIYKSWKQYQKAMKYYHICELLDPANPFAIYGLADTYRGMGRNDKALEYWLKFHDLEPHNKVAITRIGDCYAKLNDKENALLFYQKALDIDYDFFACLGVARIHLATKKTEEAEEIFEKISLLEQHNSRYFFEHICFYLEAGMSDKALELHRKASSLFPGNGFIESLNAKFIASMPTTDACL